MRLDTFAAQGFVGQPPHRPVADARMRFDIGVAGWPAAAHVEPSVFGFRAVAIHDPGRSKNGERTAVRAMNTGAFQTNHLLGGMRG